MEITTAAPVSKPGVILRLTADEAVALRQFTGDVEHKDVDKVMRDSDPPNGDLLCSLFYDIYDRLDELNY